MARNNILTSPNLTKEELTQLYQVSRDPFYFSTFIKVVNPVHGVVNFDLYPYQRSVLYQFLKERFNIILKFRQAGITELISLYCLWLCMYHPNKKVNIISIKDTVAKKVLKKIKFMYKNLPSHLQTPIINGRVGEYGSATSMEFSNGSLIESIPTSENAGRSESLSLLVIDEAAAVRWAASIWASALPTLSCTVGSTKIFKRTYSTFKKKVKPETQVVRIRSICPKTKGVLDISHLGYYTLTHEGDWKLITHSQNKGKLETWFVEDNRGNRGGFTPAHRLFTTEGWKTVKEIIERNLNIVSVDTYTKKLKPLESSQKPKKEIIKPIQDFPGYFVSNWGRVFHQYTDGFREVPQRPNPDGYLRVFLTRPGCYRETGSSRNRAKLKVFGRSVHLLVYTHFVGDLQKGYQVDHIDNIRTNNFSNNLRLVTRSENVKKSYEGHNLNAILTPISGDRLPDLLKRGKILEMAKEGFSSHEIAKEVYPQAKQGKKFVKRLLNERGSERVYISKLKLIRKTRRTIYDIQVQGDHSYISANNFVNHNTGGSAIVNSCVTGDTEIVTRNGLLRIDTVCPKEKGISDISALGIEVLTHNLKWKKVLASVNKGKLTTWDIKTTKGTKLSCTPAHKLLTTWGWKPVKEILEKDLNVIEYDLGLDSRKALPQTVAPKKRVIKQIKGYPRYYISNLGEVFIQKPDGSLQRKEGRPNLQGYLRIKLWNRGHNRNFNIHRLVVEHFIGKIPKGYVVDHLDGNKSHNYVTNLEIVSVAENTRRASESNYQMALGSRTAVNRYPLQVVGIIQEIYPKVKHLWAKGSNGNGYQNLIVKEVFNRTGILIDTKYLSKIINGTRWSGLTLSKIQVLREYKAEIFDISVEDDQSYFVSPCLPSHNTPLGLGGFYHSTWVDALSHSNGFNPLRLRWQMHPERDERWYQEMARALGPKKTAQEIDGDFLSSGNTVFDPADIRAIEECLSEYVVIKSRFSGQYKEFNEVDPNGEYFIGADCATGRATDYSSFTCMNRDGEEVAIFKGRIPLDQYAKLLGDTGEKFNFAMLAPETNDIGAAVTSMLQTEGYPNLYHYQKLLKKKGKSKPDIELVPGWLTTTKNRSVIIEGLETDIRNDDVIIKDPFFVQEAYTFIYQAGRPVAMGKHRANNTSIDIDLEGETYSDDDIFGKAICNHIRKNSRQNTIVLPK